MRAFGDVVVDDADEIELAGDIDECGAGAELVDEVRNKHLSERVVNTYPNAE